MKSSNKGKDFCVFALPGLFCFLAVVMVPFIYGIYLTLTDWNGVSSVKNFVGLSNFAAVMRDAQFWNYAEKKGYSGTAIFTKHEPLSVSYGIGIPEHDHEGRVITLEYDAFYLVTCYTPNSQNELARLPYRMQWEEDFLAFLKKLDEVKPVIVCGDLNVAHEEIDLKNPKTNRKNAGFSDEERAKMTTLLNSGFTDTFRYFYPDKEGIYSWWSYRFKAREKNAGWRIDYFITSRCLDAKLQSAGIHTEVYGSDHCPVELIADA